MASGITAAHGNEILDAVFRGGTLSYANVYLALFTDDGSVQPTTEFTGTGYARVALNSSSFGSPSSGGSISNTVAIRTPASGGAWAGGANARSFAIFSAPSGGTMLRWGAITAPYQKVDAANQYIELAIGSATFTQS